ncbi:hypothetical protein FRX31_004870 [Thalictrum thalictroides]|uniref:FBD domain-containing protein n=1 Tax=Thalictrum thalictroides TaxID=46969 RepID=A0A7J6X770_THATH|nr:hypothetical protein FRX31_004870 [Thalictrum thalictroides]
MFNRLKSVEIQNVKGCETELKFLDIFLTKALVLETITIATGNTKTKKDMPWKINPNLAEFKEKLHSLPRPSSAKLRFIRIQPGSYLFLS